MDEEIYIRRIIPHKWTEEELNEWYNYGRHGFVRFVTMNRKEFEEKYSRNKKE